MVPANGLPEVLRVFRKHYESCDAAAREWKSKGGRVVGYLCDKVPDEIIEAAGFLPVRLRGSPSFNPEMADRYLEPFYEGFVRSILCKLLTNQYDYLDFLVIPHSRDTITNLYGALLEIQHLDPNITLPHCFFFETLHSSHYATQVYNRERLSHFRRQLEEWAGKPISDQDLQQAITTKREATTLLSAVAALRKQNPPLLSGTEALTIAATAVSMPREQHNKLLRQLLENADQLPKKEGVRIHVSGSPQDNLQLYELIESCGAVVVSEDHCWGLRAPNSSPASTTDPLEAIARTYEAKPPCPHTYPIRSRVDYCLWTRLQANADAVLFWINEWDYAQIWEYPDVKTALDKKGIPYICFTNKPYSLSEQDREDIKSTIHDFLQTVRGENGGRSRNSRV